MPVFKRRTSTDIDAEVEQEQGFLSHLKELRDRLLRSVIVVLLIFLAMFPFAEKIYTVMAQPVLQHLPENTSMIAIGVTAPFLIPLKMVFVLAVFISLPFLLYQAWAFIAPGLYLHERRMVLPLLISSTLLFFLGVLFAQYVILPITVSFFFDSAPLGVAVTPDIGAYLSFALALYFAFGVAFEVPIATIIFVMLGVTTPEKLAAKRPYIIVAAFVIGMLLTPPDVFSQSLLAIPMWILFEIGLLLARTLVRRKKTSEHQTPDEKMKNMLNK